MDCGNMSFKIKPSKKSFLYIEMKDDQIFENLCKFLDCEEYEYSINRADNSIKIRWKLDSLSDIKRLLNNLAHEIDVYQIENPAA